MGSGDLWGLHLSVPSRKVQRTVKKRKGARKGIFRKYGLGSVQTPQTFFSHPGRGVEEGRGGRGRETEPEYRGAKEVDKVLESWEY